MAREGANTNITQDEAVDTSVFLARKTMIRLLKLSSRKLPGEAMWKSLTAFPHQVEESYCFSSCNDLVKTRSQQIQCSWIDRPGLSKLGSSNPFGLSMTLSIWCLGWNNN